MRDDYTFLVLLPLEGGGSTLLGERGLTGCPASTLEEARAWTLRKLAAYARPASAEIYALDQNGRRVFIETVRSPSDPQPE